MVESLQDSKTSTLVHVEEISGSSSSSRFSSYSISDILEPSKLKHDINLEITLHKDGDRRKPSDEVDAPATSFRTEKASTDTKCRAVSLMFGDNSSRDASASPGRIHDGHKYHTYVASSHTRNIYRLWARNRSCFLVVIAVIFGSVMTLFTKLLETGQHKMHPLRILFLRMVVTSILCFLPLYFKKDGGSPFGSREVRWLLVIRALSGFFGLCGIWMSIRYLDLADATVITFLTPSMVAIFSAICMKQPFTRKEQLASLLAMLGVVFIARPAMLFGNPASEVTDRISGVSAGEDKVPPSDRLTGTVLALISATGGAGAFISIRTIGGRANIFTTTLYFAISCTIISGTMLAIAPAVDYDQPQARFGLVEGATQWTLMIGIVICGLLTQLFLTAGLGGETKTNKAPAMVYTGMLWTAGFDRWVFGERMYWSSVVGCTLIVGGAIWMVMQPRPEVTSQAPRDPEIGVAAAAAATSEEEEEAVPMIELSQREGAIEGTSLMRNIDMDDQ